MGISTRKLYYYDIVASPGFGDATFEPSHYYGECYNTILNQTKNKVKCVIRESRLDHILKKC